MTQIVKGMQDFWPDRARKKQFIERVFQEVFVSYGFKPLETPVMEYLEVLTKKGSVGQEIVDEIYAFKDKAGRDVGLRFDLTVPMARVLASDKSLQLPFKRYAIERVYRYDKPGEKRYREFTQADLDIVGSKSLWCELECIAITVEVCSRLGIEFEIAVNSRKVLESIAQACGISAEQVKDCFRSIDKLEKIGMEGVRKELKEKGITEEPLEWLMENKLEKIKQKLEKCKGDCSGVNELIQLLELAERADFKKFIRFEPSLARGLDYYTGTVFEIKTKKGPSIGGGGRYDKLIQLLGGPDVPACGISFGIDRILDCIEGQLNVPLETQVFVVPLNKEFDGKAWELAQEIRKNGIACEMDVMARNVKKNLEYASKQGIPFVIVMGENEVKEKAFKLKNMSTGKETIIKFTELNKIREIIEPSKKS